MELVGLCKSVVHWLTKVCADGLYKDKGVMTDIEGLGKTKNVFYIKILGDVHFWL